MTINPSWRAAAIRGARTFAQVLVGVFLWHWVPGLLLGNIAGEPRITLLFAVIRDFWDQAVGLAFASGLLAMGVNRWKPVIPEVKR